MNKLLFIFQTVHVLVLASLLLQPSCQALYLPGEPYLASITKKTNTEEQEPSFIPINGETIPPKVIDYTVHHSSPATANTNIQQQRRQGQNHYYWLDRLGVDSMKLVQEQLDSSSSSSDDDSYFSIFSWNVLFDQYYTRRKDKCRDYYTWSERFQSMLQTIQKCQADVICLQEVDYNAFHEEWLPALRAMGYDGVVQSGENVMEIKRRKNKTLRAHVVATFWNSQRFCACLGFQQPEPEHAKRKKRKRQHPAAVAADKEQDESSLNNKSFAHMARGRTMTSLLQRISSSNTTNNATCCIINCHLEGHPRQYGARIRQLQHGMKDVVRYSTSTHNALLVAGDFNCELASSACSTYLQMGRVGKKSSLGGVHGTSCAWAMPPCILECEEATSVLNPILEWNHPLPDDELDSVPPHPFRRNSLLSAYPRGSSSLDNEGLFTYCANPFKPVAGLDQIWYTGFTLRRIALQTLYPNDRQRILQHGLPLLPEYPSDHLPIGAVFQWNYDIPKDDDSSSKSHHQQKVLRQLRIVQDQQPSKKPKSPIMAYAELDQLLVMGPFDSEQQRTQLEAILDETPPFSKQKPSPEQLQLFADLRRRKQELMDTASEPTKEVLQRIFKLKKNVAVY